MERESRDGWVEHFFLLGVTKVSQVGRSIQRKHINPKTQMTRSKVILFSSFDASPILPSSQSCDEPRTKPSYEFFLLLRATLLFLFHPFPVPRNETKLERCSCCSIFQRVNTRTCTVAAVAVSWCISRLRIFTLIQGHKVEAVKSLRKRRENRTEGCLEG